MSIKPPQKRLVISGKALKALQKRIKKRKLIDGDYELLQALTETVECLSQALAEKDTSIGRLCKYLFGAPTETAKNLLKKKNKPRERTKPDKNKGHGRNSADDYKGADRVSINHPTLTPGNLCPGCEKGKVYEIALPSVFVHIKGNAPLKATVYERTRLRCNLCGEIYTPDLPDDVSNKKYDDSAAAMLAVLKYGCGFPLYRIEKLQGNLGTPISTSTQWDILNASALSLAPLYDSLINFAAQGQLIHNDDTTMKILSFLKEQDPDSKRKGIFTTGIVSKSMEHQVVLFMTGNKHAGENLTELLKNRETGLAPPIQMCDALSRNASKEFETIMTNCISHARRKFAELVDRFPEDCAYVIEQLGTVYHHDAITKEQGLTAQERLSYHQEHSKPIMTELHAWCQKQIDKKIVEPNSGLGQAINYMLNHWKKLTGFLQIAGAPLDNNLCERILKTAILHRKNSMFYRTQHGAHVGDLFMSLIHTCQLGGVNPLDYLTWLFKNLKDLQKSPEAYMPWNYGTSPG